MSGRANGRFLKLAGFVIVVLGIVAFLAVHHNARSQLSDAQKQLKELQNDNQDLLLKLRDTRDAKNLIEMEKTKLTNQLLQSRSDHSKALDDMHKDVKELKDRHVREISDSKESIKQANDELSQCKDKRQQLEMENEKHVTILKTDLNAAKYQLDDCNKSRSDLHNRLSELQAVIQKSKTLFERMKKEVEDYKVTADSLKTKSDNMNKQVLALESQLEACKASSTEPKVVKGTPTTASVGQKKDSSVNTTKDDLHKEVKNDDDDSELLDSDDDDDEDKIDDGDKGHGGDKGDGNDVFDDLDELFKKETENQAQEVDRRYQHI